MVSLSTHRPISRSSHYCLSIGLDLIDALHVQNSLWKGTLSSSDRSGKQRSSCRCLSISRPEFSSASTSAAAGLPGPALDGMAEQPLTLCLIRRDKGDHLTGSKKRYKSSVKGILSKYRKVILSLKNARVPIVSDHGLYSQKREIQTWLLR